MQELLEDVIALVEGQDVPEVAGVGVELTKVVFHHLDRRVYVEVAAPQELPVEMWIIWNMFKLGENPTVSSNSRTLPGVEIPSSLRASLNSSIRRSRTSSLSPK